MIIVVYCEPLWVSTSANPGRGMLRELIALRRNDRFILVIRSDYEKNDHLIHLFKSLKNYDNWEIYKQSPSRRIINILGLLHYKNYCRIDSEGDIYVNMDCDYLGRKSKPLIITVADLSVYQGQHKSSHSGKLNFWLRKYQLKLGICKADHTVTISKSTKTDIQRYFPEKDRGSISVVYNGIAENWFNQLGFQQFTPGNYFIWWGFISKRKNIEGLLRGYAKVFDLDYNKTEFPSLIIIQSNINVPDEVSKLIVDLDITTKVSIMPALPLNDLIKCVSSSRGLLFPSFHEGFGVPVIEALACGRLVLASDIPALREIGGGEIEYCDPLCTDSITSGIIKLSKAQNTLQQVQRRMEYAKKFSYKMAAFEYSTLIDKYAAV